MPSRDSRQDIDALKSKVSLTELFQLHGIQVGYKGSPSKALCPWHGEKKPSLSVDSKKGLFHCFGCGKAGDHLTFLQDHVKLTFPKAVAELKRLAGDADQVVLPAPLPTPERVVQEAPPQELMSRLAEVWHQAFCQSPDGLAYLESRGLKDKEMMRLFQVGFCDGKQLLKMITAEEKRELQRLGIINERGNEVFSQCVVVPLRDREGHIRGFYGRAVRAKARVEHRFCIGPRFGFFYPEAARGAQRVLLVEGVLDAMAFYQAGFPNVMALGGAQALTHSVLEHLRREKVQELVLCLDGDQAGATAAEGLRAKLTAQGFAVRVVAFPDGDDPLSFLPFVARETLEAHLPALFSSVAARPALAAEGPSAPLVLSPAAPLARAAAGPSAAEGNDLRREYRKLSLSQGKLKVLVTLSRNGETAQATVDLYSTRSRRQEAGELAQALGLDAKELETWFFRVLDELEERRANERGDGEKELFGKVEVDPMTPAQREEALTFLRRPDLIRAILDDIETLGYVGEDEAKLLGYCVSVSRILDRPMSAIFQSGSGAGKSYLAEIIQNLSPPEQVVFFSRLSPQALYHMPKDFLVHKLLLLEERAGGEGSDYQIRSLQTSHRLCQAIVVKDPVTGTLYTRDNEVLGPIAYIETTTNLRLNPENTSRCFEIPLDESPEQTRRIHQRQKALKGLGGLGGRQAGERIYPRHHHLQRLLEPVAVVIPYVELLTFPDRWLRTRRDHDRFLCLIEVLAVLHQYQRPRKRHAGVDYIEATVEDYRWAYFLAKRVLQNSLDELSRWGRELLTYFDSHAGLRATRRELREQLQWPDRRAREALEELVDMEYLEIFRGPSNLFVYKLSPLKEEVSSNVLGLLTPDELLRQWGCEGAAPPRRGQGEAA